MQVKQYTIYAILGILAAAGSIALVATHNTYTCEDNSDDIYETGGCAQYVFECTGPNTIHSVSYGIDVVCPWSDYVQIISYISLGLSIIFFITVASDTFKHPLVACLTLLTGAFGGILLLVAWISMIVNEFQGGGGFEWVVYTDGDSTSEFVFIANTVLVFITFDLLAYTFKTMPELANKNNAQASNTTNLIANKETTAVSSKTITPPRANIVTNKANKATPKQMPGVQVQL